MTRINLLPWREERRKIKNIRLYLFLGTAILTASMFVYVIQIIVERKVVIEEKNISLLQTERQNMSDQIKEIEELQQDKQDLLNRRNIIQSLQSDRTLVVRLFDALPKLTPEGIFLTCIERKGDQVLISGVAQSNASISTFWKNMEDKRWNHLFSEIRLKEVSSDKKNKDSRRKKSRNSEKVENFETIVENRETIENSGLGFKLAFRLNDTHSISGQDENRSFNESFER